MLFNRSALYLQSSLIIYSKFINLLKVIESRPADLQDKQAQLLLKALRSSLLTTESPLSRFSSLCCERQNAHSYESIRRGEACLRPTFGPSGAMRAKEK